MSNVRGTTIVCVCIPQRPHGDVWSDEDLWAHLWKALVARPVQNCLQNLWQHEAAWATDWGTCKVFFFDITSCVLTAVLAIFSSGNRHKHGNITIQFSEVSICCFCSHCAAPSESRVDDHHLQSCTLCHLWCLHPILWVPQWRLVGWHSGSTLLVCTARWVNNQVFVKPIHYINGSQL